MPEQSLSNVVNSMKDWRVALMAKLTEWTQENDSAFVPIIAEWDVDAEQDMVIPSMAGLLGAKKEDVPQLYVLNSWAGKAMPYPEKLDDVKNFSVELILAWAEATYVQIQADSLSEQYGALDKEKVPEEAQTEEEKQEWIQWREAELGHLAEMLAETERELPEAKKKLEEAKAALKVKNDFADNLEEHLDVSEAHMTRIEQAIMEEL